jgi:hypothetical protein
MTQLLAGLALIATGSALMIAAMQTGARSSRVQRLIRARTSWTAATPYTGPTYNQHGREL